MTVGLMFDEDLNHVALVKKINPTWQHGKLNGIGGKVNEGESFLLAQIREFFEKTGIIHFDWKHVGELTTKLQDPHNPVSAGEANQVQFFVARTHKVYSVTTRTDEEVSVFLYDDLVKSDIVSDINYILPHARRMLQVEDMNNEVVPE